MHSREEEREKINIAWEKYGTGNSRPPKVTTTINKGAPREYYKQSAATKRMYSTLARSHSSKVADARSARIEELRSAAAVTQLRIAKDPK